MTYSSDVLTDFLEALAQTGSVKRAADQCGLSFLELAKLKKLSAKKGTIKVNIGGEEIDFYQAWADAQEYADGELISEARRRGVDGWTEPVIDRGKQAWVTDPFTDEPVVDENGRPIPLTVRKYSDALLTMLLKARHPEFRESSGTNLKIAAKAGPKGCGVLLLVNSGDGNETTWESNALEQQISAEAEKQKKLKEGTGMIISSRPIPKLEEIESL